MAHVEKQYPIASHARASKLLSQTRSKKYYKSRMEEKEKPIVEAIKEATANRRYGRKKVMAKVIRLHPEMSTYRIRRVYVKYGFSLPTKPSKRMRLVEANPLEIPLKKNQSWHIDFMSDVLENGRKIRTFNGIDAFNRACLDIEVDFSITSVRVTQIMDRWIEKYGKPVSIRTDNGPEFRSRHFKKWLIKMGIKWETIRPGHPQENAFIERFNGTYRLEILDTTILKSLSHCKEITQEWIQEYNQRRPHESLGDKTPLEYAA